MKPHPKQAATPAVWITLVCILTVIGGIWWWVQQPTIVPVPIIKEAAEKRIILTLANGDVLDLTPRQHKIIQSRDATIYASPQGITYSPKGIGVTSWNTLYVPEGLTYSLILADGTYVFLNSKTTVRFKFITAGRNKQLFVDGEAYFRLLPSDSTSLTVHTPVTDINASAAEFSINSYDRQHVRTVLARGAVTLTDQRTTISLTPGTEGIYNADADFSVRNVNLQSVLQWATRLPAPQRLNTKD
ncbi:FecR domain-containing protein [Chitinophaga sp. sic0106]|uniref:FecR domain-containing protein n=1 Tax=Chitinophaga sp. sic0106 TaxID=2854785 RepID=UPI001C48BF20|nr:FecR family protein [Chitinophaga sp. sic0106]MBV7532431.1 FecR family protein [Chitinophaga sp. sic0106]